MSAFAIGTWIFFRQGDAKLLSKKFIKTVAELHTERFNVHWVSLVQNRTPCGIFFGFTLVPGDAVKVIQFLRNNGLNVNCAIVIADVQADALRKFTDVPVITLEDFPRFGEKNFPVKPHEIFIPNLTSCCFVPFFTRYNIESVDMSFITIQDDYFYSMMKHLPEIYDVYNMLGSDESKKVFLAAIKGRLTGKMSAYRFATEPQYFLDGFTPTTGDIVIDGGAYDGATSVAFAKCGAKVFAFEMDAANFQNCRTRLAHFGQYDITLENLGLSDKECVENYSACETGSHKDSNGACTAKFIDLDTYVARKNLPRVDYIKLDIEGAELDMLHGAAETIKRCKPKMAVSAYHKPEDLWTLALYIKSLRPDYKFEFRHYKIDGTYYTLDDDDRAVLKYFELSWIFPTACEMVLYCR